MAANRRSRKRGLRPAAVRGAALLTGLAALTALTGCSGDDSPSSVASKAASAAQSVGAQATAAASSLASEASEAFSSATAEVGRKLDGIEGGVDAKGDVKLGTPTADGDRSAVEVTVTNSVDSTKSFGVEVDFKDSGGKLLDSVLVTVTDVPAGKSAKAIARSHRALSGEVKAEAARAVRY
ncbi:MULTISPECIES: hypothetical protein [unclassified Streptomyces]|uniref:hypothetical protein n=1 Tax=unclassified Streptomyces TaxID=2593676 RepID=UPI0007095D60|nr:MULTISPECIES: hypothetical protein [unclassified Streptomyces]KRD19033.1 hypothetical protein ASE41_19985 [Streptomyces sp. Root264]